MTWQFNLRRYGNDLKAKSIDSGDKFEAFPFKIFVLRQISLKLKALRVFKP